MTTAAHRRMATLGSAAALAVLAASIAHAALTWTPVQLLPTGSGPSAATTPDGSAAVAWWIPSDSGTPFSSGLALAIGSGDTFSGGVITTSDLAYPDVAYSSDGTAHIAAYYAGGAGGLGYVTDAGGVVIETLVTAELNTDRPSIGVDGAGLPHIAYTTPAGLFLATLDAGAWSSTQIWSGTAIAPRLAVESSGVNHVVWTGLDPDTFNPTGIFYATDRSGPWAVQTVSANTADTQPDIGVESTGVVDIVYAHEVQHGAGLILLAEDARRSKLIVRGTADTPTLAIGPDDSLHVAYWDFAQRTRGLHQTSNESGRFMDSFISNLGEPGAPIADTVTPDGRAYVVFDEVGGCCPQTGGLFVAHD